MSIHEIEEAIAALPEDEQRRLVERLNERYDEAWDRQMEADAKAGKLDGLAEKAKADHRAGRSRAL
jgi:hypothetical protein